MDVEQIRTSTVFFLKNGIHSSGDIHVQYTMPNCNINLRGCNSQGNQIKSEDGVQSRLCSRSRGERVDNRLVSRNISIWKIQLIKIDIEYKKYDFY